MSIVSRSVLPGCGSTFVETGLVGRPRESTVTWAEPSVPRR